MLNQGLRSEVPLHRDENPKKTSGFLDNSYLVLGGAKRPHDSSDSDKEQLSMEIPDSRNDGRQLAVVGQSTGGWIQVKPKKDKKGRTESSHNP